jgi:DNA repair protein RadC
MNDLNTLSNMELLAMVLGPREAIRLYRGALSPLFASGTEKEQSTKRLHAVRELIRRWLMEEMRERDMLEVQQKCVTSSYFTSQGRPMSPSSSSSSMPRTGSSTLEDLFRGTLTQTSVYPREVVKRSLQVNACFGHLGPQSSVRGGGTEPGG